MSKRDPYLRAKLPRSHYFISLAHGDSIRTVAVRPLTLWAAIALLPLALLWGGGATLFVAFHEDLLGAYVARQAEMQNAYEDRLAEARAELDRVASRQLLDQTSFEGKMHDLLSRQARLEQRGAIVAALASEAAQPERTAAALNLPARSPKPAGSNALGAIQALGHPLAGGPSDSVLPPGARAFAPVGPAAPLAPPSPEPARAAKPRPVDESRDQTSSVAPTVDRAAADLAAAAGNTNLDANARLGMIDYSLDRVERSQISALSEVAKAARAESSRLGEIVAHTGLSVAALTPSPVKVGVGGPLIPLAIDAAAPAFDKAAVSAARNLEAAERLRKLMPFLPIREPLVGDAGVSSPFGYRTDPFIGRPALHPGIDLVQAYGADIKATAAGKVVHAGPMGGYGNMVEVDHGNGISTRYGHMSEVLVEEGDAIKSGDILGRIGSTGRSTGPHLHYEVRVDGEPVDPERFRQAAQPRVAAQ